MKRRIGLAGLACGLIGHEFVNRRRATLPRPRLSSQVAGSVVTLDWKAVRRIDTFVVFRNGTRLADGQPPGFVDEPGLGRHVYWIIGRNTASGQQSPRSNQVSVELRSADSPTIDLRDQREPKTSANPGIEARTDPSSDSDQANVSK